MNKSTAVAATPNAIVAMREARTASAARGRQGHGLALALACAGLILSVAGRPALAGIDGATASAPPAATAITNTGCPASVATPGDVADLIALHRGVGSGAIGVMPHELARRPAPADDARPCAHRAKGAEGRRG